MLLLAPPVSGQKPNREADIRHISDDYPVMLIRNSPRVSSPRSVISRHDLCIKSQESEWNGFVETMTIPR